MATFKSVWIKKVIDNVSKKVFAISHVKSTYYDYSEGKLLSDKLDDMDTEIKNKAKKSIYGDTTINMGRKANTTSGTNSVACGVDVEASGENSYAEGYNTVAFGDYSHAEGIGTTAGYACHTEGKWNKTDNVGGDSYAHIVGGGTDNEHRKNIHTLDWDGHADFAGDVTIYSGDSRSVKVGELGVYFSLGSIVKTVAADVQHVIMIGRFETHDPDSSANSWFSGLVFGSVIGSSYTGTSAVYNLPHAYEDYTVRVTNMTTGDSTIHVVHEGDAPYGNSEHGFIVGTDEDAAKFLIEFSYYGTIRTDEIPYRP